MFTNILTSYKFRIVVYKDFDGNIWYKPQSRKNWFSRWKFYGESTGYSVSYRDKDQALQTIGDWKSIISKKEFKEPIVTIYRDL